MPADAGVWLWPHELAALAGLPAWFVALFVALVLRADFRTGAGRTGYGELINALTPDQPARGPRLWAPTRDDVKAALRRLESLRILAVDRLHSEQVQSINFLLSPRQRRGVASGKLPPKLSPGSTEGRTPKLPPGTLPGLSAFNSSPTPCEQEVIHNAEAVRAKLQQTRDKLAAGGRTRAPKGA